MAATNSRVTKPRNSNDIAPRSILNLRHHRAENSNFHEVFRDVRNKLIHSRPSSQLTGSSPARRFYPRPSARERRSSAAWRAAPAWSASTRARGPTPKSPKYLWHHHLNDNFHNFRNGNADDVHHDALRNSLLWNVRHTEQTNPQKIGIGPLLHSFAWNQATHHDTVSKTLKHRDVDDLVVNALKALLARGLNHRHSFSRPAAWERD